MRIAAGTAAAQCMQALRLYTALAQEEPSYILMIVTPSGIPTYQSLVQAIESLPEDRRPRLGIDLIPEGSFVSSEFPSLRPDTPNGDAAGGVR